jgi:tetratricopeptide (TPR) repeat protein
MTTHLWIRGANGARRRAALARLDLPPVLAAVDAHRRLRGPYTAAGTLARALAPEALDQFPDLVARHDVELRAVAPELRAVVPGTRETLTSSASPEERTRFYPRARTTRLAHGLTDFLLEILEYSGRRSSTVVIENLHEADPTDAEFVAILLRRIGPERLRIVACTGDRELPVGLATALDRHATAVTSDDDAVAMESEPRDPYARAAAYVGGDCTSDDPLLLSAYEALPEDERVGLHSSRAAELRARDEVTLGLGAIPFHEERGSDPAGAGADALSTALEHCVLEGFYEAVIDIGRRSLAVLDWDESPDRCWLATAKLTTAFSVLGRPDEAMQAYDDACAASTLPTVHLQSAYGRAMLYTRFYDRDRLDHQRAKAWVNTAIAIASLYPERERRAYNLTFQENGLALVEMHLGDLEQALRLVTEGLQRLEDELGPDKETLHRSVLRYNQAQLLTRLGPPDRALEAYGEVIEADPNHSEYYFERAALRRRAGYVEAAFADYAEAIRLSPPYPEPHYNRGELAMAVGDIDLALADFGRVLELDPAFVDAYVNRASLLYELGHLEDAASDVADGLALDPDNAMLHCTSGMIAQDDGRPDDARRAFDRAVALDPTLVAAWSNRAVLSFEGGDVEGALADFDRALELGDAPAIQANRAFALQHAGRWSEAIAAYTAVLNADEADRADALYQRGRCRAQAGDLSGAESDLTECARIAEPPLAEEVAAELAGLGLVPAARGA